MKILVAGATSVLGRNVARILTSHGHAVTALGRDADRLAPLASVVTTTAVADARRAEALAGVVAGHDTVFSCVGASVAMRLGGGWRGYRAVDTPANLNLLAEAKKAGVQRFVYVAVHPVPGAERTAYVDAHERVAQAALASGLDVIIMRPPAFFSALGIFVAMAQKGKVPVIGDGRSTSNPIDDRDLAAACAQAVESGGAREWAIGGPEVVTRLDIARLACEAAGVTPRYRFVPPGLIRFASALATPVSPRISQFMRFVAHATTTDVVAPAFGTHRLADYFRDVAARAK
jgi:uncharacterized protein YbjT (DUF2867 family)